MPVTASPPDVRRWLCPAVAVVLVIGLCPWSGLCPIEAGAANKIRSSSISAAGRFRNRVGDGRNNYRGADEANRLLQLGSRINRVIGRLRLDSRSASDWSQISQDLRLIANIYGNGRNDGYYGRDDGNRGNDRRDNNDWWRRFPLPN